MHMSVRCARVCTSAGSVCLEVDVGRPLLSCSSFETGFHQVTLLEVLEDYMYTRLTLNSEHLPLTLRSSI